MRRHHVILVVAVANIFAAAHVFAFRFEPITQVFSPAGTNSVRTFRIVNTQNEPIATRITMAGRSIDEFGEETMSDASDLFRVLPAQAIVQPGATQTVRVQWLGSSSVSSELSFRIVVEQLPVRFEQREGGGAINIMFRYLGSVYVRPPGARADVEIVDVNPVSDADDHGFELLFRNSGTAHTILDGLTVTVRFPSAQTDQSQVLVYGPDELKGIADENLLAGSSRRHFLRVPSGRSLETPEITFEYAGGR